MQLTSKVGKSDLKIIGSVLVPSLSPYYSATFDIING